MRQAQRCKAAMGMKPKGVNVNAKDSGGGGEGEGGGGGALSDLVVKSSGVSTPEFDPVLASLSANPIQNKTLKTVPPTYSNPKNTKKVLTPAPAPVLKDKMERESQSVMSRSQAQGQGGSKATTTKPPVFSKNNESPRTKTSMRDNRNVKNINSSSTPTHFESEMENNPEKKPLRLSNSDAANIPVDANAKFHFQDGDNRDDNEEGESLSMDMDMDDQDQDGNDIDVEDEDNATTPTATGKKGKKSPGEIKKSLEELNAPKDKNPELESRTVFAGNVPKTASKKQLLKLFRPLGEVEILRLRRAAPDKLTRKELHPDGNSIAAYIRFKTREGAEAVVAKSKSDPQGVVLGEHRLTLDFSIKKDNRHAIFIGNLHRESEDDEDELRSLFESCGMVESVRIVRNRATGLGKGYGFVNFTEAAAVEIALKKDGLLEFKNRALRISRGVKKQKVKKEFSGGRDPNSSSTSNAKTSFSSKNGLGGKQKEVKVSQGKRQKKEASAGDETAEIGKFKGNSKKPNKEDMKKARVTKQLTRPVAVDDTGRATDLPAPVGVAGQSQVSGIKIPKAVKNYKQKKKELRKLSKPGWSRENKQKKQKPEKSI